MTEIHYTDPEQFPEEIVVEKSLRPSQFDEFIGQKELIDNLRLYIRASNNREDALDHVLLFGPPGLGKTTIANIISKELDSNIRSSSGPVIERAGDLAGVWQGAGCAALEQSRATTAIGTQGSEGLAFASAPVPVV